MLSRPVFVMLSRPVVVDVVDDIIGVGAFERGVSGSVASALASVEMAGVFRAGGEKDGGQKGKDPFHAVMIDDPFT